MNHAAVSPCPNYVRNAILKHLEDWSNMTPAFVSLTPFGGEGPGQGNTSGVKESFATLVHCDPREIALVPNTHLGLSTAVLALAIKKGKNVILGDPVVEHPNYLAQYLEGQGIEVRFVKRRDQRIQTEDVERLIDDNTALVFLSYVEYSQGAKNDIRAISELAHRHGAFTLVDAFQAIGALDVDLKELDVDLMATGTYKWIMGIKGTGFLYVRNSLIPEMKPVIFGWANGPYYDSYTKAENGWLNGLHLSASRLEAGSMSIIGFTAAKAAIDYLLAIGMARVEKGVLEIRDYLVARLSDANFNFNTPLKGDSSRSGIVNVKAKNAAEVVQKLRKKGIWISGGFQYLDGVRISPHFYNQPEEVDKLVDELKMEI